MKNSLFLLIILFVACNDSAEEKQEEFKKEHTDAGTVNGETLFKANCAACHKPNEKYVGPALQGAVNRWENKELLYAFVKNSQEVIARNAYAKKLFEEYKQSPMLPYPNLSNKDIDDILRYCEAYVAE
jgi:cytochrome c2